MIFRNTDTTRNDEVTIEEFSELIRIPSNSGFFDTLLNWSHRHSNLFVLHNKHITEYRCWPPPVFIFVISIIEIILFSIDNTLGDSITAIERPISKFLIYNPCRRKQFWRYFTYMFIHENISHLVVNVILQIFFGLVFEKIYGSVRLLTVYFTGVLAGSLATSIANPMFSLAGASGGVFSLLTAHVANVFLNWSDIQFPTIHFIIVLVIIGSDFGIAIYNSYTLNYDDKIGHAAHIGGAAAGLLIGTAVMSNINIQKHEKTMKAGAIIILVVLSTTAISWNIFFPSYFPLEID